MAKNNISGNPSTLPKLALVIAGPGAGKTECLCQNVLYIIGKAVETGLDALEVLRTFLLITFTDAGAVEMKERLAFRLIDQGIMVNGENVKVAASTEDVHAMTFNSFAFELDKPFWQELGYSKELSVIQGCDPDRGQIIQDLLAENPVAGLNYKNPSDRGGAIMFLEDCFDAIKASHMDLDEPTDHADELRMLVWTDRKARFNEKEPDWNGILDLFVFYDKRLKEEGLMEFADQEPAALKLLDAHPELLEKTGYRHVIADEFQDSSPMQMEFMKKFADCPAFESVMAVGDDFQSIYGFRDADPTNMLNFFEKIGRDGETFMLTENYRSTPEVVEFGNRVIALNVNKVDKTITATRDHGDSVELKGFYRNSTELSYIAGRIKYLVERKGVAPEDIAVLSYRRQTAKKIAGLLQGFGIPVTVKIPTSVSEDVNVQAVVALSKAIESPNATELYLQYLVAKYNGHLYADGRTKDDIETEIDQLRKTFNRMSMQEFFLQRKKFHELVDALEVRDEIFSYFKERCYRQKDFIEEIGFIDRFERFGKNEERKMSQQYAGVTVTTAHSSKGLEWSYVFATVSDYDNKIVNHMRPDSSEVEEIRRLEFVAFTRAKDHLCVTGTYEAWNDPVKDPDTGRTVGRDVGYNRFLKELFEVNGMPYDTTDPAEELREKHKAAERKTAAAKAAEKRKVNAERKDRIKLARLEAMLAGGHILTTFETFDLNKLRQKYDPKYQKAPAPKKSGAKKGGKSPKAKASKANA